MANSISYIEATTAYGSSVAASGDIQANTAKVRNAQARRTDLQEKVKEMQAQLKDLEKQLDDINNKSGFEKFMGGLFGSDCGAGDVSDKTKTAAAEMKKAANDLKVESAKIEMMLNEITGTQQDLAQRTSDAQKTHDESDNAAQMAQS